MADDLVLNTIQGASLDKTVNQTRFVQTGAINNIDTTGVTPQELLWRALVILNANGYSIAHPATILLGHPTISLQKVQITGYTDDGVTIALIWESPSFGVSTAFTIRKTTRVTPYQTDMMPGTRVPLRIKDALVPFKNSGGAVIGHHVVEGDNVLFTFLKPLEEIQIYALTFGAPKYVGDKVGNVNDALWPAPTYSLPTFGGHNPNNEQKPAGYWLLSEWNTTESRHAGYHELAGSAISRVNEDWSYTGTLINRATGKRVQLDDAVIRAAEMMLPPYSNTIIYNNYGLIRVGPYPMTSFPAVFGF